MPVGEDQIQHLELARGIAKSFNSGYNCDFFPQPQPILGAYCHLVGFYFILV